MDKNSYIRILKKIKLERLVSLLMASFIVTLGGHEFHFQILQLIGMVIAIVVFIIITTVLISFMILLWGKKMVAYPTSVEKIKTESNVPKAKESDGKMTVLGGGSASAKPKDK